MCNQIENSISSMQINLREKIPECGCFQLLHSHVRQLFTEVAAADATSRRPAGLHRRNSYWTPAPQLHLPGGAIPYQLVGISHHDTFGLPRTTNTVEAWDHSYNSTVGCHHSNMWKFITSQKRE